MGGGPGDNFVERLRSEDPPAPPRASEPPGTPEILPETVWHRMERHQGEQFHTQRNLPFTFRLEGNGVWSYRNRKRVNRKLTRSQLAVAISRCPLRSTTEISDLMDYPYLFAVLMDQRIRSQNW